MPLSIWKIKMNLILNQCSDLIAGSKEHQQKKQEIDGPYILSLYASRNDQRLMGNLFLLL